MLSIKSFFQNPEGITILTERNSINILQIKY